MTGQWIIKPVEVQYFITFKGNGIECFTISADRAEIKDKHLILYKRDSIVYFCPLKRIDNFYAREV